MRRTGQSFQATGKTALRAGLSQGAGAAFYGRKVVPKGPLSGFGYSSLDDQLKMTGIARSALLDRQGPRDAASFACEAVNLVNSHQSVKEIRDFFVRYGRTRSARQGRRISRDVKKDWPS